VGCPLWREVEGKLRPTVSRPVCLGARHPSGTRDQFIFLLEIFFRQLWVCYFVAPSRTRVLVCNLLLLLVLASAVPRDSRPYFIVPIHENPPTWRAMSPYLYRPETGWSRYTPGHWVPFKSPLTTRGTTVEVFYPASTRDNEKSVYTSQSQSQSHVTTDGQSVSMSWCQVHSETCGQILFSVWNLLCCLCGAPSLTRGRVCLMPVSVSSIQSCCCEARDAYGNRWPPKGNFFTQWNVESEGTVYAFILYVHIVGGRVTWPECTPGCVSDSHSHGSMVLSVGRWNNHDAWFNTTDWSRSIGMQKSLPQPHSNSVHLC
jgi:hypothetical protein